MTESFVAWAELPRASVIAPFGSVCKWHRALGRGNDHIDTPSVQGISATTTHVGYTEPGANAVPRDWEGVMDGKSCGSCALCCKVMDVPSLASARARGAGI